MSKIGNQLIEQYSVSKYISEAGIEFLPHGVITKSHTGMGATYLELTSSRNSILVEPIKYTAYSKVESYNKSKTAELHGSALYVGSEVVKGDKPINQKQIEKYLKDKKIKVKKIICVADSLYKVVEVLLKLKLLEHYFLLIDEIDSIQTDSSFRYRIEQCLDIYFMFPKEQRALLTATPIDFSNKKLKEEVMTYFYLRNPSPTDLNVLKTEAGIEVLTKKILDYYNDTQESLPIVVCVNSIRAIITLVKTLTDKFSIDKSEMGVLCGSQSEYLLEEYIVEIKNTQYPKKITFITSAYYSGYDIKKEYKLFILADYKYPNTLLSGGQVKQIAGRYRGIRTSPIEVVYSPIPKSNVSKNSQLSKLNSLTIENMITVGNSLIKSLHCMRNNFSGIGDELNLMEVFKNGAIKALESENLRLVREEIIKAGDNLNKGDYVISYFFLDAKMESKRILNRLYVSPNNKEIQSEFFNNGFNVSFITDFDKVEVDKSGNSIEKDLNNAFLTDLSKSRELEEYEFYKKFKTYQQSKTTQKVKRLSDMILGMLGYYTVADIVDLITKQLLDKKTGNMKDSRSFDNLTNQVTFTLTDSNFTPRILLKHYFQIGEVMTNDQIAENLKIVLKKTSLNMPLFIVDQNVKSVKSLVMLAKNYVVFKRTRINKVKNSYKIIGLVPCKQIINNSLFFNYLNQNKSLVSGKKVIDKMDFTTNGMLFKLNNVSTKKLLDKENIQHKAIETPTKSVEDRAKTKKLLSRLNDDIDSNPI